MGVLNSGEFETLERPTRIAASVCGCEFGIFSLSVFFFRLMYATENMGRRFLILGFSLNTSSCGVVI